MAVRQTTHRVVAWDGNVLLSLLPSIVVLGAALLLAMALAWRWRPADVEALRVLAARALGVTLSAQAVHFVEEAATGFPEHLAVLLNLPAMPLPFFVVFNVSWLAIWIVSVPGLKSGRRAAYLAAWFLAIAGIINGVAHPLLALAAGGYFPGLISSPFIGVTGLWLCRRLRAATRT